MGINPIRKKKKTKEEANNEQKKIATSAMGNREKNTPMGNIKHSRWLKNERQIKHDLRCFKISSHTQYITIVICHFYIFSFALCFLWEDEVIGVATS